MIMSQMIKQEIPTTSSNNNDNDQNNNNATTTIKQEEVEETPLVANDEDEAAEASPIVANLATESSLGGPRRPNTSIGGIVPNLNQQQQQGGGGSAHPILGACTLVSTEGNFPSLGSILGPYFCVGKLGKGTFCSIHKCINLHHFHTQPQRKKPKLEPEQQKSEEEEKKSSSSSCRIAAAKVEIGEFRNSGVLGGEATMLQYLDDSLPRETVPLYMGHYRGNENISAILMEYLPGQDMHQIRDWATHHNHGGPQRRIAVQDAVYLTANVMLPLLQRMHQVGIVHRDVKPSNCVKRQGLKDFAMVDFGLSKSIVIHKTSTDSDPDHPWQGIDWMRPPSYPKSEGHYRKERPSADFRGTSMYASVRVHQSKDYCPRDDMWSLLYVFCDLVSGGLPWMSFAANKNREACKTLKERIHGEVPGMADQTEQLLMGHEYHLALFKQNKGVLDPPPSIHADEEDENGRPIEKEPAVSLPTPLALSKDREKVRLLRKAFDHLGKLSFHDMPDYDLLQSCILGFLEGKPPDKTHTAAVIDWERLFAESKKKRKLESPPLVGGKKVPTWDLLDHRDDDAIDTNLFLEAVEGGDDTTTVEVGEAADLARLPLEFRFRLAQMEYHAKHPDTIPPHLALRDWFQVVLPLLYGKWDSKKFEKGGHRTDTDGYRRELYLNLINKCLTWSSKFNHFRTLDCIYETATMTAENGEEQVRKKRRIVSTIPHPTSGAAGVAAGSSSLGSSLELISISKISFQLRAAKRMEAKKAYAPPPRLSFGR